MMEDHKSSKFLEVLNRKVFNSTHLCHLTAVPPILPPHSCHVSQNPGLPCVGLMASCSFLIFMC
ncbi:hypothetical protein E2C01_035665 [Portunus trituberculatus]|uniref:Uncharacterized protein n=1 Tax=Portunus trituberculatus TaxID=210409 RepID=A0A5B7F6H8_PORTR|nr:hypothetical protein [Portunus trituberculatus]